MYSTFAAPNAKKARKNRPKAARAALLERKRIVADLANEALITLRDRNGSYFMHKAAEAIMFERGLTDPQEHSEIYAQILGMLFSTRRSYENDDRSDE